MGKETLYRFELAFDGIPQDVGFLQGLADTAIPLSVQEELYGFFDSLPVPPVLSTEDGSCLSCWFTKNGLSQFAAAINDTIYELSSVNWQVIGKSVCIDTDFALYSDAYQVIFSRMDLLELTFPDPEDYKEVAYVDPVQEKPIVFCGNKPSLDTMIKRAQNQKTADTSGFRQQENER